MTNKITTNLPFLPRNDLTANANGFLARVGKGSRIEIKRLTRDLVTAEQKEVNNRKQNQKSSPNLQPA